VPERVGVASVPGGTITVSAAASLTDVFPAIARAFGRKYPGVTVRFNFGGSTALVEQVIAGAPVDVLATASEQTMGTAVSAGRVGRPLLFARNRMAIAMPPDNPARITHLADLSRPGVLVATCAVAVPCGTATRDLLARNGVTVTPVTLELDVRAVLGKVMAGEVDAGVVYVTDVRAVGSRVSAVFITSDRNVVTTYPIAAVTDAPNPVAARAFVDYVRFTSSAQGILRAYGFARPW
jgi:molybdate transport system substrate-binding protein